MSTIESILADVPVPELIPIRQQLSGPRLPEGRLEAVLADGTLRQAVRLGESIAIAVGSRGVADQPAIVAALVAAVRARGADPFIVPAMGSHGGASASGQAALLSDLGVSERSVGAPVRSSMVVDEIGNIDGLPVLVDRNAMAADGILIVNRIKPHPSFRGERESGLAKMIAIGLGKQAGAEACHRRGMPQMAANVLRVARHVLGTGRVRAALAIVENALHQVCHVELIPADRILDAEPALLERARQLQPSLPFSELDVLIVDQIGKDIAGTGVDCNVIGRYSSPAMSGGPAITRIAALRLTPSTHGNANGVGLLDVTTDRVFRRMTFEETYPNALTSTAAVSVKVPMVMRSDSLAIRAAIQTAGVVDMEQIRLVRIRDSLSLAAIEASPAAAEAMTGATEKSGPPASVVFDTSGDIIGLA